MEYHISSTRHRLQIVAAETIRDARIRMRIILTTVTGLVLGLFVLYNSFPWLTAELRGCVYNCQHQTVVAVSLVRTFNIQPSLRYAGFPMKYTPPSNSSCTETCSEYPRQYRSSLSWELFLNALCCHKIGTTERVHSWYSGKLEDQLKIRP